MTKIFEQDEVTLAVLADHLADSGLQPDIISEDTIRLRTPSGIGYRISIMDDPKFIRLVTYFPLSKTADVRKKLELEHTLNEEVFMPSFYVDDDGTGDLWITYVMPYQHGLIAGQFTYIVNRYASLLQFLVDEYNADGVIDFDIATIDSNADADGHLGLLEPPKGSLIN